MTAVLDAPVRTDNPAPPSPDPVLDIRLDRLHPSPLNRKHFDAAKLQELGDSLIEVGQLNDLLVRPHPTKGAGQYEIAAGERRWRAATKAKLATLRCRVRDLTDAQFLEVLTIENLQREDVHPLDEALGYQALLKLPDYDVDAIAGKVAKSVSYVYQRLKLVDLVEPAKKAFWEDKITAGHAILIARLQPKDQAEALKAVFDRWDGPMSVRDLARWIEREVHLDLHAAAFKKDDAQLVPAAGACTTCPKRTGFTPALFPDIAKKDTCTDRACFHEKVAAHVAARRAELEAESTPFVQISERRHSSEKGLPKGALGYDKFNECGKGGKGAKLALVLDGAQAGKTTYVTQERQTYGGNQPSPGDRARIERQNREGRIRSAVRRRLWDAVVPKATEAIVKLGRGLQGEEHLFVVQQMYRRLWNDHQKLLCQLNGWKLDKHNQGAEAVGVREVAQMSQIDATAFMLQCALVPFLDFGGNAYFSGEQRDRLKWMAGRVKVKPETIEKTVRAEFAAKAKKPTVQTSAKPKPRAGDVARARKTKPTTRGG